LCGSGHLFSGWFGMCECCPGCGHRFEREEGFFLGAYVINFIITGALLSALVFVPSIVIFAANADASPVPIVVAGLVGAVAIPIFFYPFSKTIWSAIDLVMRPVADDPGPRS